MSGNVDLGWSKRRRVVLFILGSLAVALIAALFFIGSGKSIPLLDKFSGGSDPELDQKLNSLDVNLDLGHFDRVLGKPAIATDKVIKIASVVVKRHARPRQVIEEIKYREYFYIHEGFYVQVITDEAGKVGLYSITARGTDYRPNINTPLAQPVRLGQSMYGDLQQTPIKIAGVLDPDATNSFYYEVFPDTSAQGRLAVFSSNTNGYLAHAGKLDEKSSGFFVSRFGPDAEGFPIHAMHGEFRKTTTINTYSVVATWLRGIDMTSSGVNYGSALINFGPRADQLGAVQ
jgi:hypothetical protein